MKIIVGLGNPGRQYAATRHNLGFMVVDEVARRLGATERRTRYKAEVIEARDGEQRLVFIKPQTYMNLSGISVREAMRWYKPQREDVLIVVDDIDLPFGSLRMRAKGSSGGHNGLKSIFAETGTQELARLRIGIGRGERAATGQVLSRFSKSEQESLPELIDAAADCVMLWARNGVIEAMNRCNRRPAAQAQETAAEAAAPAARPEP